MVPAGLRWISDGRGEVRYRLDGGFPRRRAVVYRGARTHLTSSSFPVSRCGAPSISVTSVPLVPPSARSASLHAALAIVGACTNGRMRASAPTTWTVAFRIPEKTDGLSHPHKNDGFRASLKKADALPHPRKNGRLHPPHPRRGRCPHRPAAPAAADLQASGSEKRSRDNATTTPTTSAPSATGRQLQESQKS